MDDELTPLRTVQCHTEGCGNRDIPVTMHCLDLVVCGACGNPITDITPA